MPGNYHSDHHNVWYLFPAQISEDEFQELKKVYRGTLRMPEHVRSLEMEKKQIELFGQPIPLRKVPSFKEELFNYICEECGRNLNCFAHYGKGFCPDCQHHVKALLVLTVWEKKKCALVSSN